MFGCQCAVPEKFRGWDWKGTDNDSNLMRLKKKFQYWFSLGPLGAPGPCHSRELPKTLIVLSGNGPLRYETSDGSRTAVVHKGLEPPADMYLSRIQPWTRWHVSLNWPLYFNSHAIYRKGDVVAPGKYKSDFGIGKMATLGLGYKRDGDRWHILTANFGGNFE